MLHLEGGRRDRTATRGIASELQNQKYAKEQLKIGFRVFVQKYVIFINAKLC